MVGEVPMSVYVDALFPTVKSPRWRYSSACHLMGDSLVELHLFAVKIGLKSQWFQGDHYDLTPARRRVAVAMGAIETTSRHLVEIRRRLRGTR
jgi:hypothetical protein